MILALFTAACFAVSTWLAWRVRNAYLDMHNPRLGNWTVDKFFDRVYAFIGMVPFAPASLVLTIVAFANDGEISNEWSTAVAVAFTLLGALVALIVFTIQAFITEKMLAPRENMVIVSEDYHRTN